ncbi:hypothetical protein ACL02T_29860 [Pseudonocardia sp. RS010]|uniref:hypothetical protein n=1 Tax=Pseudonocardia sp. RS010 TaxID=3385979 RepID=UPI0039A2F805
MNGQTWRGIARWLLWSRRRFVAVLAVVVVAALALSHGGEITRALTPHGEPAAATPTTEPATPPAPSVTSDPAPLTPAPTTTSDAPAEPSSPRAVAEQFAKLWAAPDLPAGEWLGRLLPLSTDEYGSVVLAQIDPQNVPARAVAGSPRVISQAQGTTDVAVPMDTMTLRVELVDIGGGTWRVSDVKPLSGA